MITAELTIDSRRTTFLTTRYAASPRWESADLSSLRSLMCAGAPVPQDLIYTYRRRGLVFFQGYGLTETAPGSTFLEAAESSSHVGSAGAPVFFTDVRIVPLDRPGAGETFVKDPPSPRATGRRVFPHRWAVQGHVHFRWRERLPGRGRGRALRAPGGRRGGDRCPGQEMGRGRTRFRRAVTWRRSGRRRAARVSPPRLAKYKMPARFTFAEALPLTGSGKIREADLRSSAGGARRHEPDRLALSGFPHPSNMLRSMSHSLPAGIVSNPAYFTAFGNIAMRRSESGDLTGTGGSRPTSTAPAWATSPSRSSGTAPTPRAGACCSAWSTSKGRSFPPSTDRLQCTASTYGSATSWPPPSADDVTARPTALPVRPRRRPTRPRNSPRRPNRCAGLPRSSRGGSPPDRPDYSDCQGHFCRMVQTSPGDWFEVAVFCIIYVEISIVEISSLKIA